MKQLEKELDHFIVDSNLIANASFEQLNSSLVRNLISKENLNLIEDISTEEHEPNDDASDSEKDNFIVRIFKFIGKIIKGIWDGICSFFRKIGEWLGLVEEKTEKVAEEMENSESNAVNIVNNALETLKEAQQSNQNIKEQQEQLIELMKKSFTQFDESQLKDAKTLEEFMASVKAVMEENVTVSKQILSKLEESKTEVRVEVKDNSTSSNNSDNSSSGNNSSNKPEKKKPDPMTAKRNQLNVISNAVMYIRNKDDYKWFSFDDQYDPFKVQQIYDISSVSAYVDSILQYFNKTYNRKSLENTLINAFMKLDLQQIYGGSNKKLKEINGLEAANFTDHFVTEWYKTFKPTTKKYTLNVSPTCRVELGDLTTAHRLVSNVSNGHQRTVRTIKADYAAAFKIIAGSQQKPITNLGNYDHQTLTAGERTRYLKELAKAAEAAKKRSKANALKRIEIPEKDLMQAIAKAANSRLHRQYPIEKDRNLARTVTNIIRDINDGMVIFSKLLLKVSVEFGKVIDQQTNILNKRMGVQ